MEGCGELQAGAGATRSPLVEAIISIVEPIPATYVISATVVGARVATNAPPRIPATAPPTAAPRRVAEALEDPLGVRLRGRWKHLTLGLRDGHGIDRLHLERSVQQLRAVHENDTAPSQSRVLRGFATALDRPAVEHGHASTSSGLGGLVQRRDQPLDEARALREAIANDVAAPLRHDDPHLAEDAQMLARRGPAAADDVRDVARRERRGGQGLQDAQPRRVSEELERFSRPHLTSRREARTARERDTRRVDQPLLLARHRGALPSAPRPAWAPSRAQ